MRALFIEDDELNRRIVEDMLRVGGAEMVGAANAPAGLEIFAHDKFDIVLVDLRMPGMDGFEAIRRIRAQEEGHSRTPVVVVTADTGETIEADCRACGADAVLLKPVAMRDLFETIADLVVGDAGPHKEQAGAGTTR